MFRLTVRTAVLAVIMTAVALPAALPHAARWHAWLDGGRDGDGEA